MTKDEHNKILNDLRSATISEADRMALIIQLEKDYTGILSERDVATTTAKTAQEEVIKYAKLNNELFLANSQQSKVVEETITQGNPNDTTEVAPKRTFEDLESKFD